MHKCDLLLRLFAASPHWGVGVFFSCRIILSCCFSLLKSERQREKEKRMLCNVLSSWTYSWKVLFPVEFGSWGSWITLLLWYEESVREKSCNSNNTTSKCQIIYLCSSHSFVCFPQITSALSTKMHHIHIFPKLGNPKLPVLLSPQLCYLVGNGTVPGEGLASGSAELGS